MSNEPHRIERNYRPRMRIAYGASASPLTLTDFLLARIAEDETVAESACGAFGIYAETWWGQVANRWRHGDCPAEVPKEDLEHIARHDPVRVLAECEAKRKIIKYAHRDATRGRFHLLRVLALPYAGHSDYREEWRI